MREENFEQGSRQEVCLPQLRKQDILQAENKNQKTEGDLTSSWEMAKINEKKVQEMQILEQNLQNLMFQKQAFQMELSETQAALREIENSGDEVYKIIGQLMIKSEKNKVKDELLNKEKIIELRIKSIEKQEDSFAEKLEELREEFLNRQK